jgi:cyclopropane-fatty-acyl-phospholipid synthase
LANRIDRFLQERVLGALAGWCEGRLSVRLPDGGEAQFGIDDGSSPAELRVHDARFFRRLSLEPDVGIGESYVAGEWSSPALPDLITSYLRNAAHLDLGGSRWIGAPLRLRHHLRHWLRRNSRRGSERNIHDHYDLGNDFFRLFLDESLAYSSGIFPSDAATLEEAQQHKYRVIASKLKLAPGDRVLEIGCGWGGFALFAARECGCHVTAITISREQYDLARARVREAGLESRVDVQYRDYRDLDGSFDKVVSIEMLEAVGEAYWSSFFATLDRVLTRDGLALIQVICVPDQRFASYRRSVGWMQRYIFPGGLCPSLYELQRAVRRVTGLELHDVEEIGLHYARTLRHWRERFWKALDHVRELGFDERFVRVWDYYLSLCEAGFAAHENRDLQLVLTRPNNRLLQQAEAS